MKIIHSCWTKPMLDGKERWNIKNQLEMNLWLYGYSVHCANSIGLELELYTDDKGTVIFDCLPYTAIHTDLNELDDTHERFWSAGKILALEKAPLGSIHIDGDVFLQKDNIIPILDMNGYDCIVQMEERLSIFMETYNSLVPMFKRAVGNNIKGLDYSLKTALNSGVFAFNNQVLKDEYIFGYFQLVKECQDNDRFMLLLDKDKEKKVEINPFIEQYYLANFCHTQGYKIKNILQMTSDNYYDDVEDMNRQAKAIGYCHAWGSSKYRIIDTIKEKLQERNPSLFKSIEEKINNIK